MFDHMAPWKWCLRISKDGEMLSNDFYTVRSEARAGKKSYETMGYTVELGKMVFVTNRTTLFVKAR